MVVPSTGEESTRGLSREFEELTFSAVEREVAERHSGRDAEQPAEADGLELGERALGWKLKSESLS